MTTNEIIQDSKEEREKASWLALRETYRVLGSEEGNKIVKLLLDENNKNIKTSELLKLSGLSESKFHVALKALVTCVVVDKHVNQDRSVSYNLSPFGRHILELSEPILEKIQENFGNQRSELMAEYSK